jgi:hypothetical protein
MTTHLASPTPLGAPVDLHPGEWLHSAISRWAWETFGVSRGALLDSFGLGSAPLVEIAGLGTRLPPAIAANIARATGIDKDRLHKATMEGLDGSLLWLTVLHDGRVSGTLSRSALWSWQAGTRYCPDCLHDQPGVFHLTWRSPWIFACMQHRRLLHDACSTCQGALVEMRGRNRDLFDPSTCRANVAPPGATRIVHCRARLDDTWDDLYLDNDSAPIRAQRSILCRMEDGTSMEFLSYLQAVATGLRGAKAVDDIASLSGLDTLELRGLLDDEKHVGISAPKNAYAMAALIGAAFALFHTDEFQAQPIIRMATFSRSPAPVPRDVGFGPGSPRELLSRWPTAPPPFRAQILRALDHDLSTGQRILWDSAATPTTLRSHRAQGYDPDQRLASIPTLLWPEWCSRFDIGSHVDLAALARSLASAVRVAGAQDLPGFSETNLAAMLRPNMLGGRPQTDALLAGISELAHTIDDAGVVIDYPRRAELPSAELLPPAHWERLAASIRIRPGTDRRIRNARRYLWQRLTGADIRDFPEDLRVKTSRDDTAEYTIFRTQLTADLQQALDRYGRAFLLSQGIDEPVTWSPNAAPGLNWPGPEILDLNIERLHSMLRSGIYNHRRLADALRVTPRRILRAIDAAPPPTVYRITHLDWHEQLPPLRPGGQHQ